MTIELELFRTNDGPYGSYVLHRSEGPVTHYAFSVTPDGQISFWAANVPMPEYVQLPLRRWIHAALVLEGTVARAYVDGVLRDTTDIPGMPVAGPSAQPLAIGSRFPGAIRNLRFWGRAIPATEIARIATGEAPATFEQLLAHWPMDDGQGQFARDVGPNSLQMFLGNSVEADALDPHWLAGDLLKTGPYWDLKFMPSKPGVYGNVFVVDATGDGLPDIGTIGTAPAPRCEYPYYPGVEANLGSTAFRNLGGGHFIEDSAIVQYQMASEDRHVGIVDLTNDGRKDVIVIDHGPEFFFHGIDCGAPGPDSKDAPGGQSRILVATPNGILREETRERFPARVAYDHGFALGDFDGDGDIDLYLAGAKDVENDLNLVSCAPAAWGPGVPCPVMLINDGTGHFTEDFTRLPLAVATHRDESGNPRAYTSGQAIDVDRDGDQDLVLGGWSLRLSGPRDTLLLNDGTGHFDFGKASALPERDPEIQGGNATFEMGSADFDGDGWPDLLNVQYEGTFVYMNNQDGTFRRVEEALPPHAADENGRCRVADLNADGRADIFCPQRTTSTDIRRPMALYYNRGDGTFDEMPPIDDTGEGGFQVYAMDADGDGDVDLMGGDPYVWVAYQRKPYVPRPRTD